MNNKQRSAVTDFGTKEDLIQACLASVHIPFFLDGRVRYTSRFHTLLMSTTYS